MNNKQTTNIQLYDSDGNAVYTPDQAAMLLLVDTNTMRVWRHRFNIGFQVDNYTFFTEEEIIQMAKKNRKAGRPNKNKPYTPDSKWDLPFPVMKLLEKKGKL